MKIRQRSSSFYFLSELLFVILCFALGSVLCVRLFALASAKHYLALDQNQALRLAQPLAAPCAIFSMPAAFRYAAEHAVAAMRKRRLCMAER